MNKDDMDYFGQSIKDALLIIVWSSIITLLAVGTVLSIALNIVQDNPTLLLERKGMSEPQWLEGDPIALGKDEDEEREYQDDPDRLHDGFYDDQKGWK